jgi:hypothetical protein
MNEEREAQEILKQKLAKEEKERLGEMRRAQRAYHRQYVYCFGELTEQMITCKFPPEVEMHDLSKMKW